MGHTEIEKNSINDQTSHDFYRYYLKMSSLRFDLHEILDRFKRYKKLKKKMRASLLCSTLKTI